MKDYKIDLFDYNTLIQKYDKSLIKKNIIYSNIEKLIYDLFNSNKEYINISYQFYYQELLEISNTYDDNFSKDIYFKKILMWENGELFSPSSLDTSKEYFDEKLLPYPKYKKIEYNFDGGNNIYMSDEFLDIYLKYLVEQIYKSINDIGINIIGFSGITTAIQELQAEGIINEFNFIIQLNNKKGFIEKSIKYLESLNTTEYSIGKLKELAINKIKKTNDTFGKNGNNIPIEIKSIPSKITLLILHLEGIININKFNNSDKKIYIDINKPNIIIAKKYTVKEGELIINDGEIKIELAPLEMIILQTIRFSHNQIYISDFEQNSSNPIAVIKKIRKKIKNKGITGLEIITKRDKFTGDTEIKVIIE